MNSSENVLTTLEQNLPPIFPRKKVAELTYGLINPRTLANKDCNGTGPIGRFKVKKEMWYSAPEFLIWLKTFITHC